MELTYNNYDNIDIDEELNKIILSKEIFINLQPTNKKCLFLLGMMFALGKKIKILNEKELNLNETNKSFSLMPYVWSKISDNSFPNNDYSNVVTEMDKRIENIKRLGVSINPIHSNPIENKIFLICPVRNATKEQKKEIENYTKLKNDDGYIIHAPHLHTVQSDLFGGYAICLQNANAVATSSEVDLYYDQNSTGSVFDLGVAYSLSKPLKILNKDRIEFNNNDFIDNIVENWPFNKVKTKQLLY